MDDLYLEEILDHFRNPRNWGFLAGADVVVSEHNASCGDVVKIYLNLGRDEGGGSGRGLVREVGFEGEGCAISRAATSMLLERLKSGELKLEEVGSIDAREMKRLVGVEVGPLREKCLMLPVVALKKGLA